MKPELFGKLAKTIPRGNLLRPQLGRNQSTNSKFIRDWLSITRWSPRTYLYIPVCRLTKKRRAEASPNQSKWHLLPVTVAYGYEW